eukprot:GHVT01062622.1.p1 GENE.GHVT01062622.1~~GHVT01062622.1.p1  ORF type:complete len:298 (-),score=56.77 GHVT01062622.1:122-925(-)
MAVLAMDLAPRCVVLGRRTVWISGYSSLLTCLQLRSDGALLPVEVLNVSPLDLGLTPCTSMDRAAEARLAATTVKEALKRQHEQRQAPTCSCCCTRRSHRRHEGGRCTAGERQPNAVAAEPTRAFAEGSEAQADGAGPSLPALSTRDHSPAVRRAQEPQFFLCPVFDMNGFYVSALGAGGPGGLLAAGTSTGAVLLFHESTRKFMGAVGEPSNAAVTSLSFSPLSGALAAADQSGRISIYLPQVLKIYSSQNRLALPSRLATNALCP